MSFIPNRLRQGAVLAFSLAAIAIAGFTANPRAQGQGGQAVPEPPPINQSANPLLADFKFRSIGPGQHGRPHRRHRGLGDQPQHHLSSGTRSAACSSPRTTACRSRRCSRRTAAPRSATSRSTRSDPNIVYVGTGEPNNRQTASFGDGIYKTTDGGKTFTNIGLKETQTIARIVIDPKNPETVYVASPGHLFGPNPERGVYKTTDGGKTWNLVKFIDNDTGFTDIVLDPANSNIVYAASYQRRRSGCCFNGGGPGSGIWKSMDAGKTWTKITGSGLPPGTYGRIALDVSRSNPNVVYAQIEAGETGTPERTAAVQPGAATEATPAGAAAVVPPGGRAGQPGQPGATGVQAPAAVNAGGGGGGGRGNRYDWCNNAGPGEGFGRGGGRFGQAEQQPQAPRVKPDLDPKDGGVFRSDDKGKTWTLLSNCDARPMYFSQLRVDPSNDKTIYVAGLPVAKSLDGGKTFATLDEAGGYGEPGHVDQHAIWIDPKNPNHIMEGNDGGLNICWDQGKSWDYVNTMATALAYVVSADMRHPYYVYIGLQDNGSWGGPSAVRGRGGILNSHWFGIGGGDGFYTAVDPSDYHMVITESQDGSTTRYNLQTGGRQSLRPNPGGGRGGRGGGGGGRGGTPNVINGVSGEAYRFNWNTPVIMSPHNPKIVYLGGNHLFKSYNQGDTWVASEADLTKKIDRNTVAMMGVPGTVTQLSKNDGVVSYSTIITISESPVMPGIVWVGTDDGNVQVSQDGGMHFTEVGKNLPGLPAGHQVPGSHASTRRISIRGRPTSRSTATAATT